MAPLRSKESGQTLAEAVLERLVFDCVRHYADLWDATQRAKDLVAGVERAKAACDGTPEQRDRLTSEYVDRAWRRIAAERGELSLVAPEVLS